MYRVIYKCTRLNTDIPWFQKDHRVEEISEKYKLDNRLICETFITEENGLTAYYTAFWADRDFYNEYLNEPEILEWRLARLVFQSETGSTNDLLSAKLIL